MNKIKKQTLLAFAATSLVFGLVACGDDSSSSVGPNDDEEITSSSSEEDVSSSSKKDKSSSSTSKEKSSSSTSKDKSSSSTKKDDSSSSTKEKSSSSVKDDSSSSVKEESSSSEEDEVKIIGVVFDGGDYMVPEGELRTIDSKGNVSKKSLSFYQDTRVVANGDYVYVLEGLSADNITKVRTDLISEGAKKAVVWQASFANANPIDMAFDGENAWIALQNADSLVKISTKDSDKGKVVKSIKIGEFASEGQTAPYVADIEFADGKLYVLMQRYYVDSDYNYIYPKGLLAVYDGSTGDLQDTLQLLTNNPQQMSVYNGALYIASLGAYDGGADDSRGLEKIDLETQESKLVLSGEKLGAGLYGFVAENGIAYATLYKAWGSTPVVKIDLKKNTFESVKGVADAQKTMFIKDGILYVGDRSYGEEKLYVYKDKKLTVVEQPEGAQAPYSIALF